MNLILEVNKVATYIHQERFRESNFVLKLQKLYESHFTRHQVEAAVQDLSKNINLFIAILKCI